MMKLILNSNAKNEQGSKEGIYVLREKLINSYPYWEQQNGSNAIWFRETNRRWYIGPKNYLGGGLSGIRGPRGIDRSPTQIINGWRYYDNGIWKDTSASEIIFKDLTPGKRFFKVIIHCTKPKVFFQ